MKKSLTNHLIFSILIGLIGLISPIRSIRAVRAGEMTGGDYIIKMGTINIKTGTTLPVPKESASSFGIIGEPFSLTVSTGIVDFGTVKPAAFSGSSLDLTVNGAGVGGYYVSVIEDHPLTTKPDITIPDTACDPSDNCTPTHASPWISSLAYGFGYSLIGPDTDQTEFADATYFRPFANNAAGQNPIVIISRRGRGEKTSTKLTFRLNVPPSQISGSYQNTVQFIALPAY